MTQYDRIGALLKRKNGATAADLIAATMSTSVHRRMKELRDKGWTIVRTAIPGKSYGTYHGQPPRAANGR